MHRVMRSHEQLPKVSLHEKLYFFVFLGTVLGTGMSKHSIV